MNAKYIKYAIALFTTVTAIFIGTPVNTYAKEETINYMGEGKQVQTDESHSKKSEHDLMHVHDGWNLGRFCVRGFSGTPRTDEKDVVYLKNPGDKIKLSFQLDQDINKLNGQENLSISNNKKGYDDGFNIPEEDATNFGKGTLLIKKTDYKNETTCEKPYVDYLKAVEKGADTDVVLFEEGDYEVALDYKIKKTPRKVGNLEVVPEYSDYRIAFTFKIRNGNCMVYPFDIATGSELTDEAITENGFKLDMAKSRYLTIDVKKAVVTEGANGYVEDVRFNRPAKDGDEYTDEGIYTFSVKNLYTDESTTKTIYVGSTGYMRALSVNKLTVAELNAQVEQGASIDEAGKLVMPTPTVEETPEPEPTEEIVSEKPEQSVSETPVPEETAEEDNSSDSESSGTPVIPVAVGGVAAVGIIAAVLSKKKKKYN